MKRLFGLVTTLIGAAGLFALGTAACESPEPETEPLAVRQLEVVATRTNVSYGPDSQQRLDVYMPDPPNTGNGPTPVLIYTHGGLDQPEANPTPDSGTSTTRYPPAAIMAQRTAPGRTRWAIVSVSFRG